MNNLNNFKRFFHRVDVQQRSTQRFERVQKSPPVMKCLSQLFELYPKHTAPSKISYICTHKLNSLN